ncbi:peptidase S8/S53 domain-containing protein [Parasitella parasitica]|nr:peptidase S8/S53 domain-containing protein [Parasitella parasitica]
MLISKTFIFIAVSYLTTRVSANSLEHILHSGNGNYILQLNQTTCIKHFVPEFIDGAFKIFSQNFGGHEKLIKSNNSIVRRDTQDEQVHVFDAYDIGNSFKGISVKFEQLNIVKTLLASFNHDIIKIIPDQDIQFDLPTSKKAALKKRYYARASKSNPRRENRVGNFDYDHYKHDKTTVSTSTAKHSLTSVKFTQQASPQWNLARISEHKRALSKPYIYDTDAGSGTYVYVIDDGLNVNHKDFGNRAKWGWSAYKGASPLGEGHGTHVAGIIGSKTYGVAKKTNLIAVQVLNDKGTGSISSLLAGLQWVNDNAKAHKGKAIINMSLGMEVSGTPSSSINAFNAAISAVVDSGIPLIAAAGNWGDDSCGILPAANPDVYTVAASDKNDKFANYSSWGKCVSVIAPGTGIKSTFIDSNTSTETLSGTSMASPHVAGVAALLIRKLDNPTPSNLYKELTKLATKNLVTSVTKNTPNVLLFNGQTLTKN